MISESQARVPAPPRRAVLELRQLRYFVVIFEEGSLTKAAAKLLVAQSALSAQLAQLEDELGVKLLNRTRFGVSATPFGQAFYEHSRGILCQVNDAVFAVRELGQTPRGSVVVGMSEWISAILGLPIIQATREQYPDLKLVLHEDLSGSLVEKLKRGEIDLAIMCDNHHLVGLATKRIVEDHLCLVSRRFQDESPQQDTVTFAAALRSPLILPDSRNGVRVQVEKCSKEAGLSVKNLVAEINSVTVTKNAVLGGMGKAIIPFIPVAVEIQQGLLHAQEIVDPSLSCSIVLSTRKNAVLNHASAAVSQLMIKVARELFDASRYAHPQTERSKAEIGGFHVRVGGNVSAMPAKRNATLFEHVRVAR